MQVRLLLVACAIGLLAGPAANAAPSPNDSKTTGPSISAQIKPIDDLVATVKSAAKNMLPESMYKEFDKEALSKIDLSQIKGIDTKKPIGMYATLDAGLKNGDFSKSSIVLLVPISDEKDFAALLEKLPIKPEKKDDVWSIQIPNAPVEASIRILKGYAYVAVSGEKIDSKQLLAASEVIDPKETAAFALRIRVDRILAELKEAGIQFFSQVFEQAANAPAEAKPILEDYLKLAMRMMKMTFNDGKEVAYRLDLDPKMGTFVVEFSVDGKPNTDLAKSIAGLKPTTNDFTAIIGSDSAAHGLLQMPLYIDEVKSMIIKGLDLGEKKILGDIKGDAPKEAVDAVTEAFKTLSRTVKSGNLDLAASLRGPDKNEQFSAIAAMSLKDTAGLDKSLRAAVNVVPKEVAAMLKIDSFKVDGVGVHEILISEHLPPEAQKIFGKSNVYVALAPDAALITFGAEGKKLMTEALGTKFTAKPAAALNVEISGKRIAALIKQSGAPLEGPVGPLVKKLASFDKLTVFAIKVEGGDRLVIREEIGIAAIAGMVMPARATKVVPAAPAPPKKGGILIPPKPPAPPKQ